MRTDPIPQNHVGRRISRLLRRTLLISMAIGLLITLFSALWLRNQDPIVRAEYSAYDQMFHLRGGLETPNNIVVVGVDAESLASLSNNRWPVPRRYIGQALHVLQRDHAKVVGLDFEYFAPSTYGPSDDRALARAIDASENAVLVNVTGSAAHSRFVSGSSSIQQPINSLALPAAGVGAADISTDFDDEIRGYWLSWPAPSAVGGMVPSFAAQVAATARHQSPSQATAGLDDFMLLNFVGRQSPDSSDATFPYYSLDAVISGAEPAKLFRNKIVLIIPAYLGVNDVHATPVGAMYGGFLQANAINTILRRIPITPAGSNADRLVVILLGLFATLAVARLRLIWASGAALALAVIYPIGVFQLFEHTRIWTEIITPEITLVLVFAAIMAFRFATEERLRRKVKQSFALYLKPELVEILAESADPSALVAARRREISVLFADIRGFTAMSEAMDPADVVRTIDVYLEELTRCVEAHDGMINKYVGDELIGMWNYLGERSQPDHAMRAVRAALDMVAKMETVNERLAAMGLPSIRYGIGVNSGVAIVGEMGSSLRKQYDMIGDSVNTGARICSAAEGGQIIIGQHTWEQIGDRLIVEETARLHLKGKSYELRTFSVLGLNPASAPIDQVAAQRATV
jgi:adenylate cyclase